MRQPSRIERLAFLVGVTLAAGCAATSSVPDGTSMPSPDGLLVMQVTADANDISIGYVDYASRSNFGERLAENMAGAKGTLGFSKGRSYLVIPTPQGTYMWSTIHFGRWSSNIRGSSQFTVRAGAITYIGHLNIYSYTTPATFNIADDSVAMKEYLHKNYPKYSAAMPFENDAIRFAIRFKN